MKHPSDAELALYAGGDLSWAKQKLTDRHVKQCGACQAAVVEYSELRPGAQEFPKLHPNVQWNRLASEMTANIRLGLAAGECVGPRPSDRLPLRWGFGGSSAGSLRRLGIASAVLCGLAGVGFILEHPPSANQWSLRMPGTSSGASFSAASLLAGPGTVLEASESGLQISEGSQTLRLLNTSGTEVSRSVGGHGEVGARYLDANGYVTVSQVYGQ